MAKQRLRLEHAHRVLYPHSHGALRILHRAYDNARAITTNVWEFAVSLAELLAAGVDPSDLRRLVAEGLVKHGLDQTKPAAKRRTIRCVANLSFTDRSNFVLSDQGLALASTLTKRRGSTTRREEPVETLNRAFSHTRSLQSGASCGRTALLY